MIRANEWGFLPQNNGVENARALQRAVDMGGTIVVEQPGVYDLGETVKIGSDTELIFGAGVYLRCPSDEENVNGMGYVFINKGAYLSSFFITINFF